MANIHAITALADPTRRAIFERIANGPVAVGVIARDLPVSRPAVSQHLKVLKLAGLVNDRQDANRRLYSLDQRGLEEVRAYFDRFWNRSLNSFKQAAEQRQEEVP
jgi:DNA-binding transcriptional ArsR family regulator